MSMLRYTFRCPNPGCQCATFEEILEGVTQTTPFGAVFVDDEDPSCVDFDYGNASSEGGELSRYQCQECGHTLTNPDGSKVSSQAELAQWLKTNGQAATG